MDNRIKVLAVGGLIQTNAHPLCTAPWSINLRFMQRATAEEEKGLRRGDHGMAEESGYCCGLFIKA